ALASKTVLEIRRARGRVDAAGRVLPGGVEGAVGAVLPWIVLGGFTWYAILGPRLAQGTSQASAAPIGVLLILPGLAAAILVLAQAARRSARRQASGALPRQAASGLLRAPRTAWRRAAARVAGLDLPVQPVLALAA